MTVRAAVAIVLLAAAFGGPRAMAEAASMVVFQAADQEEAEGWLAKDLL